MDTIVIKGNKPLCGVVKVSGAKNAVLPAIAATILAEGLFTLKNIPLLKDVHTIANLLKTLGCQVNINNKKKTIQIDSSGLNSCEAPYELVKTMRASCLVMGPLIAKYGQARISLPGGCAIGERPIDLHLKAFESLGAKISLKKGYIIAQAKGLKGANIYLDIPTVTGTENIMMAATLADGVTTIENAAKEPEIVNLADMLNSMGAKIKGAGTGFITIKGIKKLKPVECTIIPDRIETGTFMVAAAITKGNIHIKGCIPDQLDALTSKLLEAGANITTGRNWIKVKGASQINPVNIKTSPYPGFPTDMQAQMMALMTLSTGTSVITEHIFENRFMHTAELKRMGANLIVESHTAYVKGVSRLEGVPVMATDLRASACLILAALAARGTTHITRIYHLDRGYEQIEKKLTQLGANIKRSSSK